MPLAADLLLAAVDRRTLVGEDRLTELLAAVLQHDRELADWFCGRAGIEIPSSGSYEVATQVWLNERLRPDMVVSVRDRRGAPVGRVGSEHKTNTSFHGEQESGYPEVSGDSVWLAVVPRSHSDPDDPAWRKVTWDEIAVEAERLGRTHPVGGRSAGPRWRERALAPTVPARLRVLHEFLAYLERSEVEVTRRQRIEPMDVIAYGRAREARDSVEQLFVGACALLPERLRGANDVVPRGQRDDSWFIRIEGDTWADDDPGVAEVWAEVLVSPIDHWREDGYDEPAFAAGLGFSSPRKRIAWPRSLTADDGWAQRLGTLGITAGVTDDGRVGRLVKTLYLSEVMSMGTLAEDQAQAVADWATEALDEIMRLEPPSPPVDESKH